MHRAAQSLQTTPGGPGQEPRPDLAALLHVDRLRRVTAANPQAVRLLGRSVEDLRGAPLQSLAPPAAQVATAAVLAVLMHERPGSWRTIELTRADGTDDHLLLEVRRRAQPDDDGHLLELRSATARAAEPLLTDHEREVLARVASGRTGGEIAAELFLAPTTVERRVANAIRKLGARNRPHAVARALQTGALDGTSDDLAPPTAALETTIEAVEDPAALLRTDGVVVAVNEAWRALADENGRVAVLAGENYLDVCVRAASHDEGARAAAGLREVLEDRLETFDMEYRLETPDGPRWFRLGAVRHRRTDGAAALVRHRDITPQRLAERQARLGAAILDGVEAATFVYAQDGTVTAWMDSAEQLFGSTAAEAIGRPVWELVSGRGTWAMGRAIVETVARTGRWSGELEFERADGSAFHGHVRHRLVRDRDDRSPGKIVGVVTDVTAQRDAEKDAARASAMLDRLAGTMRDGWVEVDALGRITHVNAAALRMLGREAHELVGHGIERIVGQQTAGPTTLCDATDRTDGPAAARDVRREWLRTEDGRPLLVDFSASRVDAAEGEDGGWTIVFWSAEDA